MVLKEGDIRAISAPRNNLPLRWDTLLTVSYRRRDWHDSTPSDSWRCNQWAWAYGSIVGSLTIPARFGGIFCLLDQKIHTSSLNQLKS